MKPDLTGMEMLFILLSFERFERELTTNPKAQKLYASITNKLRSLIYPAGS